MDAAEKFEIHTAFKNNQDNILNDQLDFKSHVLHDRFVSAVNIIRNVIGHISSVSVGRINRRTINKMEVNHIRLVKKKL